MFRLKPIVRHLYRGMLLRMDLYVLLRRARVEQTAAPEDGASASVEARLWFYDTTSNPNHPAGAFAMTGTISESGAIELTPGEWISEIPSNWGAAGIVGVMHTDEWTAEPTGPGTSECQYFRLSRLVGLD